MNKELAKVLRMVEEGKINAAEGEELIRLINDDKSKGKAQKSDETYTRRTDSGKVIRIKVFQGNVAKVNLTVPLKLVSVFMNVGKGITAAIPDADKYLKESDFDVITEAIEQQVEGNIIDLETEEGERVLITIE